VHGQPSRSRSVKVLKVENPSCESGEKRNLSLIDKIITLTPESWVRLLLDFELHIAGLNTGYLVSLPSEIDFVAVWHTPINRHV
jgi:hypothetical protein